MTETRAMPIRRACRALTLSPSSYYYRPRPRDDSPVIAALNTLAETHPREGFRLYYKRLRQDGAPWNHKRLHRVYCRLNLNLPRRGKKRLPGRVRLALEAAPAPDHVWSVDFMHDALYYGRAFRTFNVVDDVAGTAGSSSVYRIVVVTRRLLCRALLQRRRRWRTRLQTQQQTVARLSHSLSSAPGLGAMPAFADEKISDAELDDLLAYLKALRHAGG